MYMYAAYTMWLVYNEHVCSVQYVVGLQCTCMQLTECGWFTMNMYAVYTMWCVYNVHVCSLHNVVGLQ